MSKIGGLVEQLKFFFIFFSSGLYSNEFDSDHNFHQGHNIMTTLDFLDTYVCVED